MAKASWSLEINEEAIAAISHSQEWYELAVAFGLAVETEAKRLAPFDTGNLRRSITSEVIETDVGWAAVIGTNVYYGIYQELGTRFHPAHPFLRPALAAVGGVV